MKCHPFWEVNFIVSIHAPPATRLGLDCLTKNKESVISVTCLLLFVFTSECICLFVSFASDLDTCSFLLFGVLLPIAYCVVCVFYWASAWETTIDHHYLWVLFRLHKIHKCLRDPSLIWHHLHRYGDEQLQQQSPPPQLNRYAAQAMTITAHLSAIATEQYRKVSSSKGRHHINTFIIAKLYNYTILMIMRPFIWDASI